MTLAEKCHWPGRAAKRYHYCKLLPEIVIAIFYKKREKMIWGSRWLLGSSVQLSRFWLLLDDNIPLVLCCVETDVYDSHLAYACME